MKGGQRHRLLQFWGRFFLVCLFSGGLERAHTLVNVLLLVMLLKCGNPICFANEKNGCFVSRFMPTSERARERLIDRLTIFLPLSVMSVARCSHVSQDIVYLKYDFVLHSHVHHISQDEAFQVRETYFPDNNLCRGSLCDFFGRKRVNP